MGWPLWQSIVAYRSDQRGAELLFHNIVFSFGRICGHFTETFHNILCSQRYWLFKKIPILFEYGFICVCFSISLSIWSSVVYGWQSLSRWNSMLLWDSAQMLLTTNLSLQARNSKEIDSPFILHTGTYRWLQACYHRDLILLQQYTFLLRCISGAK